MDLEETVKRYYAALSSDYDRIAGYLEPEEETMREPIRQRFRDTFRGRNVLEIACGTGYWTNVIAETASSVLATDTSPECIALAENRCRGLGNVSFSVADAYVLKGIDPGFDAAFAHWWLSHVPREKIRSFIETLHTKLKPGALVLFRDHLSHDGFPGAGDAGGNTLENRPLPDGSTADIVKNYLGRQDLIEALDGIADDVRFIEYPEENSWDVIYRKK